MRRHLNIGAGRIVWQDIVRIDVSIKKRQFHKSPNIVASMQRAKDGNGRLHLLGLVSCVFFSVVLRASYLEGGISFCSVCVVWHIVILLVFQLPKLRRSLMQRIFTGL
jgi:hypothetical protein